MFWAALLFTNNEPEKKRVVLCGVYVIGTPVLCLVNVNDAVVPHFLLLLFIYLFIISSSEVSYRGLPSFSISRPPTAHGKGSKLQQNTSTILFSGNRKMKRLLGVLSLDGRIISKPISLLHI
jgi:hypothetical protein